MLEFMREGGMAMWFTLIAAIAVAVIAVTRKAEKRPMILGVGSLFCVISGMVGMATGMMAVSAKYSLFEDKVAAVAVGLGELSHNGLLGGVLALVLGLAALITWRARPAATA
jgi:hypothetical protein